MSDSPREPFTPTIFNVMSMWLYADPVMGSTKRPDLRIDVFGNVPRITVRTKVEGDKNNGKIEFKTDLPTFATAMHMLKRIADGTATEDLYNFDYRDDFVAGKKLDQQIIISTLQVGRDKDGRLYIAVLAPMSQNRPRIQFFFGPSKFHDIRTRDGQQLSARAMSEAYAVGFLEPATRLVEHMLVTKFDPDAKNVAKPPQQGGGYNGGQRPNNGYSNNQRPNNGYNNRPPQAPAADFDADIPDF